MNQKGRSTTLTLDKNIGTAERIFSVLTGSLIMYSMFIRDRSLAKFSVAGYLLFRGISGYCFAYKAVGKDRVENINRNINIQTTLTVNKPRHEVYDFWRKLENLPLFMKHIESIETLDERTSKWSARIPGGIGTIDWKAEIVKDEVNERIGWQSLPDANIYNAGNVNFRDAGRFGTEVHVAISYRIPGGMVGKKIGKMFNPLFEEMVKEDIKNFKRFLETGEVPTIAGQPSGKS